MLARFPRFFWRPDMDSPWDEDWPIVSAEQLAEYPALRKDLEVWSNYLEYRYRRLNHASMIFQNRYWRRNVALIIGSFVATCLGVLQTAMGASVGWLAVLQASFTALLAQLAVLIRLGQVQQKFRTNRLKAEWIKSEYYLFLARTGDYASDDRMTKLQQSISDIERAEGSK